jgi:hypothetical protein
MLNEFKAPMPGRKSLINEYKKHAVLIRPCPCSNVPPEIKWDPLYVKKGEPGAWSNRGRTYHTTAIRCDACGRSTKFYLSAIEAIFEWLDLIGRKPKS